MLSVRMTNSSTVNATWSHRCQKLKQEQTRSVMKTTQQSQRQRGQEGCASPHIRTVAPANNMNLACFNRFWATFVGRWAIFYLYSSEISRSLPDQFSFGTWSTAQELKFHENSKLRHLANSRIFFFAKM